MRMTMLNKVRWKRWRKALRGVDRVGGTVKWWWGLIAATMPAGDRIALPTMDGTALCEEGWVAWSQDALRGT